jgi:hypothetical protein
VAAAIGHVSKLPLLGAGAGGGDSDNTNGWEQATMG